MARRHTTIESTKSPQDTLGSTGAFWLDRLRRSEPRLPWTRGGDGARLWELCAQRTGSDGP
jgi:hypothetical protein